MLVDGPYTSSVASIDRKSGERDISLVHVLSIETELQYIKLMGDYDFPGS